MIALLFAAVVACLGVDDTAAIQSAVDTDAEIVLRGPCAVRGTAPVLIPGGRRIDARAAVVTMLPGCPDRCALFATRTDAVDVLFYGGTLRGDMTPLPYGRWRVLWRVDGARQVTIRDTRIEGALFDAVWVGGNLKAEDVVIEGVTVREFGRNAISVVNASGVEIVRCDLQGASVPTLLGAGVDVEPNAGEWIERLTIRDNLIAGVVHGIYDHTGAGRYGVDHEITANEIDAGSHGIVVNSVRGALVYRNRVTAGKIGLSIGSSGRGDLAERYRARDVIVAGNAVIAPRAVVIAGVADSRIVDNDLGGGRVETVALGSVGRMTVEAPIERTCDHEFN
jgi:hypothetical protein